MTAADVYSRTAFYLRNDTGRPLVDADVQELLGTEMTASMHDVLLSSGVVTNVAIVDDGARVRVTIENGGRACAVCGTVFTRNQASQEMLTLGEVRTATPELVAGIPGYADLAGWVWVCSSPAMCLRRQQEQPAPGGDPQ